MKKELKSEMVGLRVDMRRNDRQKIVNEKKKWIYDKTELWETQPKLDLKRDEWCKLTEAAVKRPRQEIKESQWEKNRHRKREV